MKEIITEFVTDTDSLTHNGFMGILEEYPIGPPNVELADNHWWNVGRNDGCSMYWSGSFGI